MRRTEETSLSVQEPRELIIDRMIKADEEGFRPAVRDLIVGLLLPGVQGAKTAAAVAAAQDRYTQSGLRGAASVTLSQTIRAK